jgi:hypothetical protein
MPTLIIRLTRETAFRETLAKAMVPMMSVIVIATVRVTIRPVCKEPRRIVVTRRIMARAEPIRAPERRTMEIYWSKKI